MGVSCLGEVPHGGGIGFAGGVGFWKKLQDGGGAPPPLWETLIPGGNFGTWRLSSYQVISKEKLVNTLNIIMAELYQTVLGI